MLSTRYIPGLCQSLLWPQGIQAFVVCFVRCKQGVPRTRQTAITMQNPFMRFCRAKAWAVCVVTALSSLEFCCHFQS